MKKHTHLSTSEAETKKIASIIAQKIKGGEVICLYGELGAGKTTFVKGLAEALGISENITSPTFTLMNVYALPENGTIKNLVHIDTYRLKKAEEFQAIGGEDYLGRADSVAVVEWPELIEKYLPKKNRFDLTFTHTGDAERAIVVEGL